MLSLVLLYDEAEALLTRAGNLGEAAKALHAQADALSKSGEHPQTARAYGEAAQACVDAKQWVEAAGAKGKEAAAYEAGGHNYEAICAT